MSDASVRSLASKDHAAESEPRSLLHASQTCVIHSWATVPVAVTDFSLDQCQRVGVGQLTATGSIIGGDDFCHAFGTRAQTRYRHAHLLHGRYFVAQILTGARESLNAIQGEHLL